MDIDSIGASIPVWKAMVQAKRHLSFLVHRHLMLVLASHLGKSTNTLMDPLVAINLFTTTRWVRWGRDSSRLSDDSVNLKLKIVSKPIKRGEQT